MSIIEGIIGPVAKLIDKIIPDPDARDRAKLELIKLDGVSSYGLKSLISPLEVTAEQAA